MKTKTKRIKARSRTKTIVRWALQFPCGRISIGMWETRQFAKNALFSVPSPNTRDKTKIVRVRIEVPITLPAPKKRRGK